MNIPSHESNCYNEIIWLLELNGDIILIPSQSSLSHILLTAFNDADLFSDVIQLVSKCVDG